jgi:hypothetical protein
VWGKLEWRRSPPPLRHLGVDSSPHFPHGGSASWQHAVLQAVEILAVDGRNVFPCQEAEEDAGREVMLADAMGHLEVLVEHGTEGKWDRLCDVLVTGRTNLHEQGGH